MQVPPLFRIFNERVYMYHISDLKLYARCKRLYWLTNEQSINVRQPSLLRNDEPIVSLLTRLFDIDQLFIGIPNDGNERFVNDTEHVWYYQVRLEYSKLRIKTPLMYRQGNRVKLYFTVLLPNPSASDALSFSVVYDVLSKMGFIVEQVFLVHTEPEYIRGEELDVHQALCISEYFYNELHKPKEHVLTWMLSHRRNIDQMLVDMDNCLQNPAPRQVLSSKCTKRPRCHFYESCFGADAYDDHSVFNLFSSKHREDLYWNGVTEMNQITNQELEGFKQQYAQIMADKNGGEFFDRIALTNWLENVLQYPLSFIDFEWETYSIPPYNKMKALSVIPFQYSLDILTSEQQLIHYDFLEIGDTREAFIKSLLARIPSSGSIVAFNADGAEKIRLSELGDMFPAYKLQLDALIKRFVDLSVPFNNGVYYNIKQRNGFSLKAILSTITDNNHSELVISDGVSAIMKWRKLATQYDHETYLELLEYCRLDTMGMVLIYKYLKNLIR
jgi:hypothetical protein